MGGISPWIFTGFKIGERSFFNDFLHEVILGEILLHEKEEEEMKSCWILEICDWGGRRSHWSIVSSHWVRK
jgi:hypothetical protein